MVTVISLGGSIVAPATGIDPEFLRTLRSAFLRYLEEDDERKLILVVGGGALARSYQKAVRGVLEHVPDAPLDWLGIWATRVNAQLVRAILNDLCPDDIATDPTVKAELTGRVLVSGGWKPGFSTDNVAVHFAKTYGATRVVNLSNIEKVYTADPKTDPEAKPIDTISWKEYRRLIGTTWEPGKNSPFDPVASETAERLGLVVINASGTNIPNLEAILRGSPFIGTTIRPG
jgi:uridylate kinase